MPWKRLLSKNNMVATILILEFLLFSFIGGILDLLYNFATERKWSNTGYFKAPFCPIYGVGALILIFVFKMFAFLNFRNLFISDYLLQLKEVFT